MFWEWLILGSSPLRKLVSKRIDPHLSSSLPNLKIELNGDMSGTEEAVKIYPCQEFSLQNFKAIGGVIGLATFFGCSDLHLQNFILGQSEKGQFLFSPIDIECIFDQIILPSQTMIISGGHRFDSWTALQTLSEKIDETRLAYILSGYENMLEQLYLNLELIKACLTSTLGDSQPIIRVLLRPTADYQNGLIEGGSIITDLISSETQQLNRGDIPYFFRRLNSKGIFFFKSADLEHSPVPDIDLEKFNLQFHESLPDWYKFVIANFRNMTNGGIIELSHQLMSMRKINHSRGDGIEVRYQGDHILYKSKFRAIKSIVT